QVSYDKISELVRSVCLRGRCLVCVANSSADGVSGIQESQMLAARREIYRMSDIVFSARANDRKYFLGEGSDSRERVVEQYGSLKPCVVGSDAHGFEALRNWHKGVVTWIKADPTFDGLRQILFEPTDRVRIQADMPEQKAPYQTLSHVCLNETGFWDQPLSLNPGLVAIIGGRSSGKSNLLSAIACKAGCADLRVGYDGEESSSLRFVKDHLSDVSIAWTDGVAGPEKVVEYFPQGYMIDIADNREKIMPVVWGILKDDPQNQELKREFDSALNELKSLIAIECSNFFTQRDSLQRLNAEINERGGVKSHEVEVKRLGDEMSQLKKQHMDMTDDELREFEDLQEQEHLLLAKRKETDDDLTALKSIGELPEAKFFPNIDIPLFSTDVHTKVDKKIGESRRQGLSSWRKFIADVEQTLKTQQSSCAQKLKELREGDLYKKGAKHILENGQLNELAQKIRYEEGLLADVKKLVDRKQDLERKNAATIDDLSRHHYEFYTVSCKFAESIRLEKNGLSIAGGIVVERDDLNRYIDGRMTRVSKDQKDWYDKILAHDSFDEEKVKEFLKQTMQGDVQYNKDVDEKTVVVELLSTCWFRVNYDIVYQNDRLSQMSPGKRSFVILQLLLEFSNKKCPILIDQPEDNLDNRAIFKDLVTYLRTKKKERQIILVTHNPNVVVGADAEQVIVANQHGNDSVNADNVRFAYASGSLEASWGKTSTTGPVLESQGIREHVCEILEGGEEAFKKRESKYGLGRK
ncbi:MAG: ATP-binding protein, partial [Bacteroidales bacterium]|nr:ATP-binding protein [Bacteroidales bacterium]